MRLTALLLLQTLSSASGADTAPPRRVPVAPDSQQIATAARDAQARFERDRRWHLPVEPGGRPGHRCEQMIGRMCHWTPRDDERRRPPEPERIRRGRETLLAALDSMAAALPGDGWIAGQRVRYLLESGRPSDALAAARSCRADAWWCGMLAGLAFHAAAGYERADSAFAVALAAMPPAERCRATDLSLLLDPDMLERYRRLPCDARAALETRIWWLADPLYAVGGNDRRTEHFARVTLARVQEDAATTFGLRWGNDLREGVIRFGSPTHWSRAWPAPGQLTGPHVIGLEPAPSWRFFPAAAMLDRPTEIDPADWDLDPPLARERYSPAYARHIVPLPHQVAAFRRGDSTLVVAAYDLEGVTDDAIRAMPSVDAALVLARDEHTPPVVARRLEGRPREVLIAASPWRPALVGVEVIAPALRRGARARLGTGHERTGRVSVSDLLVFDPDALGSRLPMDGSALPVSLPAVVAATRGAARLRADEQLGLFWEIYGLEPSAEVVDLSLVVSPAPKGWSRRAAEAVGLARGTRPVRIEWRDGPRPGETTIARALALGLSRLPRGRYRIELTARIAGHAPVTSARDVDVISAER